MTNKHEHAADCKRDFGRLDRRCPRCSAIITCATLLDQTTGLDLLRVVESLREDNELLDKGFRVLTKQLGDARAQRDELAHALRELLRDEKLDDDDARLLQTRDRCRAALAKLETQK